MTSKFNQVETRATNDTTIKVNRYRTNTCSSECPWFHWPHGVSNVRCKLFAKDVPGGLFEKNIGVFDRCDGCLRSFPDHLYTKLDGVPEFIVGHEYRYRRRGQHRTYLCVYIGTDHLSRPGFETPYHTWYGDISDMEWMSVEPVGECIEYGSVEPVNITPDQCWDIHSTGIPTAVHIRDSHSNESDEQDAADEKDELETEGTK